MTVSFKSMAVLYTPKHRRQQDIMRATDCMMKIQTTGSAQRVMSLVWTRKFKPMTRTLGWGSVLVIMVGCGTITRPKLIAPAAEIHRAVSNDKIAFGGLLYTIVPTPSG